MIGESKYSVLKTRKLAKILNCFEFQILEIDMTLSPFNT